MAKQSTEEQLKSASRIVKRIIRKSLKNNTLDYTVQFSTNSVEPEFISYAVSITSPAPGLAPIAFICKNYDELIEQLKASEIALDQVSVEKAFHNAQIEACKRTILGHEERLKEIEKEENKENEDGIQEGESEVKSDS